MGGVEITLRMPVRVHVEDGWRIASCDLLDVHSQGRTKAEAMRNLGEAIHLFIESCYERGTLDEVLRASGFRPVAELPGTEKDTIRVSVPLASDRAPAVAC